MTTLEETVNYYTLSRHPRNCAIIDITNKKTGQLQFIKIRHRLENFYAVSIVEPKSFDVWAETQVKSASAKIKPITLQGYLQSISLKDTSIFGFEWSFEWENQKFKWVKEGPLKANYECKAIRGRGNDICVAQYLPKGVKNEYFGLISILGYNFVRCQIKDEKAIELLLMISLMTILDKSDDPNWKKEKTSQQGTLFLEPNEVPSIHHHHQKEEDDGNDDNDDKNQNQNINKSKNNKRNNRYSLLNDIPISLKEQQQKEKTERNIEQRLQGMLEKDVKRSQRQMKRQSGQHYSSSSTTSSPFDSPNPSPTSSSHHLPHFHQHKQLDYINQMLSTTLKHSTDATATLPTYLVQPKGYSNITTSTNQYRSVQSIWNDQSFSNKDNNDDFIHHADHHQLPSSRHHSIRRLSSIDHLQITTVNNNINNINNNHSHLYHRQQQQQQQHYIQPPMSSNGNRISAPVSSRYYNHRQ
ncbi:unnamed protein product [Cunninghamella blakesleeana]